MRKITEQQFAELEKVHGAGMVIPMEIGEDDFVFRRPTELDLDILLEQKDRGEHSYLEECCKHCILAPDAPRAGVDTAQDKLLTPEEQAEIVAERQRLSGLWKAAPLLRDSVSLSWAELCGWGMSYDATPAGGGQYHVAVRAGTHCRMEPDAALDLTARVFSPLEYSEWRKRKQASPEGVAERYAWDTLVQSGNKNDIARTYPFVVLGAGGSVLPGLGSEGKTVRPKKFGSGLSPLPGSTTSTQSKGI